jgi:hypothetical protein
VFLLSDIANDENSLSRNETFKIEDDGTRQDNSAISITPHR